MSFCGFFASPLTEWPARSPAARTPRRRQSGEDAVRAVRGEAAPAVKLLAWKVSETNMITVSTGTAVFQIRDRIAVREQLDAIMLTTVNTAINNVAQKMPLKVSVPFSVQQVGVALTFDVVQIESGWPPPRSAQWRPTAARSPSPGEARQCRTRTGGSAPYPRRGRRHPAPRGSARARPA